MNRIAIPALLLGVVMIAGAFAFMPVEQASTVHTTTGISSIVVAADDQALDTNADLVADSATVKNGSICFEAVAQTDSNNEILTLEISSDGTETEDLTAELEAGSDGCVDFTGYRVFMAGTLVDDTMSYAGSYTERTP